MPTFFEVVIPSSPEWHEMLIAELTAVGYDSFLEDEQRLLAYVEEELYQEASLVPVLQKYLGESPRFTVKQMEDKNWNEEWEKNFQPVLIEDQVMVRASFHPADPAVKYDLIVDPKMSFGTGHHETTYMMLSHQLELDHQDKLVLDAGTGTGVLSIMASRKGAKEVESFDTEDWAFENLKENIKLNNCGNILAYKGMIHEISFKNPVFDILLANINKNVLLAAMPAFSQKLKIGGHLLLSGFYTDDINDLVASASKEGLRLVKQLDRNRWASLVLVKDR